MGGSPEDYWASVVATALVALAFQPLRRGVQRLGDRAVYGRRAAPYQALADLCRRLARAVSLEQVLPGMAEVSGRSIGAAQPPSGWPWPAPTTWSRTGRRSPAPGGPARQRALGAGVGGHRAAR